MKYPRPLLARVKNVTANNLALLKQFVDFLKLGETDNLNGRLDQAAGKEIKCLGGVSTVANVGTLNVD